MTIAAIATGPGRSALGVIRISGARSLWLLETFVRPVSNRPDALPFAASPRRSILGILRDAEGNFVDEVLAVFFPVPLPSRAKTARKSLCTAIR